MSLPTLQRLLALRAVEERAATVAVAGAITALRQAGARLREAASRLDEALEATRREHPGRAAAPGDGAVLGRAAARLAQARDREEALRAERDHALEAASQLGAELEARQQALALTRGSRRALARLLETRAMAAQLARLGRQEEDGVACAKPFSEPTAES